MVQRGGPPPDAAPAPKGDAPVGQASLPEVVAPEPGSGKGERPGPKPEKRITETYLASRGPDAIDLNERKWSQKKSDLRTAALAEAEKFKPNPHAPLFGSRLDPPEGKPVEGDEAAQDEPPAEGEKEGGEEQTPAEKEAAELRDIAKRDRENRKLRKELRKLEGSRMSAEKKVEKLKELAKTNRRGVMAYLGISDGDILREISEHGEKPPEAVKLDEAAPPRVDEELQQERSLRRAAELRLAQQQTISATQQIVEADGGSRWADRKSVV